MKGLLKTFSIIKKAFYAIKSILNSLKLLKTMNYSLSQIIPSIKLLFQKQDFIRLAWEGGYNNIFHASNLPIWRFPFSLKSNAIKLSQELTGGRSTSSESNSTYSGSALSSVQPVENYFNNSGSISVGTPHSYLNINSNLNQNSNQNQNLNQKTTTQVVSSMSRHIITNNDIAGQASYEQQLQQQQQQNQHDPYGQQQPYGTHGVPGLTLDNSQPGGQIPGQVQGPGRGFGGYPGVNAPGQGSGLGLYGGASGVSGSGSGVIPMTGVSKYGAVLNNGRLIQQQQQQQQQQQMASFENSPNVSYFCFHFSVILFP